MEGNANSCYQSFTTRLKPVHNPRSHIQRERPLPALAGPGAQSSPPTVNNFSPIAVSENSNNAQQQQQQQQNSILSPIATPTTPPTRTMPSRPNNRGSRAEGSMGVMSTTGARSGTNNSNTGASSSRSMRGKPNTKRSGNAPAKRQSLFWVHSDPQSVAEGAKEDTLKRIRSHVMAEHNRKKRLENTKRHKGQNWESLSFQTVEPSSSSNDGSTNVSTHHQSPSSSSGSLDMFTAASTSSSPTISVSSRFDPGTAGDITSPAGIVKRASSRKLSADLMAATAAPTPSPWSYLGGGSRDPFDTVHTQLSDNMLQHLQYCECLIQREEKGLTQREKLTLFVIVIYVLTPLGSPLSRQRGSILQSHWMSLIQQGPAPLHAVICVGSTNAALLSGKGHLLDSSQQFSNPLALDIYHHRGETIRLVNEGLSDPVLAASDALITAVSTLLTIEV